jgi:hypothetical protein
MRTYLLMLNRNGTITYRKYRSLDQAQEAQGNARAMGYDTRIKIIDDGEILN